MVQRTYCLSPHCRRILSTPFSALISIQSRMDYRLEGGIDITFLILPLVFLTIQSLKADSLM